MGEAAKETRNVFASLQFGFHILRSLFEFAHFQANLIQPPKLGFGGRPLAYQLLVHAVRKQRLRGGLDFDFFQCLTERFNLPTLGFF